MFIDFFPFLPTQMRDLPRDTLLEAKQMGFCDKQVAQAVARSVPCSLLWWIASTLSFVLDESVHVYLPVLSAPLLIVSASRFLIPDSPLLVPGPFLFSVGSWTFSVFGASMWNELPLPL